jgi:hypothetical protein
MNSVTASGTVRLTFPDNLATSPRTTFSGTKPKPELVSFYDANLWGINRIFDWWSLVHEGRGGK